MAKLYSFLFLALLCSFVQTKADYIFWQGTTNNQWHLPSNWSPAVVPGPSDIAVIGNALIAPTLTTATVVYGIQMTFGTFTIAPEGALAIRGPAEVYAGTLINNGSLRHESSTNSSPSDAFYIYDSGKFVNSGLFITRNFYNLVLRDNFTTETLENTPSGVIELYGNATGLNTTFAGTRGIVNQGTILYWGSGSLLLLDETSNTNLKNSGRIVAAGQGITNSSGSQIVNENCGVIDLRGTANYSNGSGITNNSGLILLDGALTNSSTFLNTGAVRATSFSAFTNQGMQINNDPNTPIFVYGTPNSYTVSGIYKDSSNVNTAGVFTAPNSFVPNSIQSRLYALVGNGTCAFYVPFVVDPSTLPVTLASFGISREGRTATLTWSTTSESKSSHFEVEYSTDAKIWKNIGDVPSHGESSRLETYSFMHANMSSGNNYYRLKLADLDESFAYSRIVSAQIGEVGHIAGNFYPNPARGWATIDLEIYRAGVWTIISTDLTGRVIYKGTYPLNPGLNKVSIPQTGSGLRLVKLTDGNEAIFRKLVSE